MAQDIRVVNVRDERGGAAAEADGDRETRSRQESHRAIEQTRGRMSATLDELETRLGDKRRELRERLEVLRPVRERIRSRRWQSLGIAAGIGVALGLIGGDGGGRSRRLERPVRGRGAAARHAVGPSRR